METLHEVNDIVAKESNFEIQARKSLQSQKELRENLCSEYKVNYYLLRQRVAWTNNFTMQMSAGYGQTRSLQVDLLQVPIHQR